MPARESASVLQLFRFTDRLDKGLVLLGTLGCIGTGMTSPITMLVLGSIFNAYGNVDAAFSYRVVDEYALKLLYVAFGVGSAAFIEGVCWTRTAERQASRMRTKYLESVLKQDVGFFDTHASSTTYKVVSTVSSDAHTIQDVISEKLPNFLSNTSTFFFSIFVAFEMSWRLSLAALPFSLLFIVPGVVYGRHLMELMMKMKEAYVDAGGLAEQSISSIRTVASYVGEHGTLERFSRALEQSTKLGIKQGFMKGMVIGSIGMIFAVWAFQTWIGSILVIKTGAQGGPVFVSGVCVIFGGMAVMSALPNVRYLSEAMAAASRILEMIDTLPTIDSEDGKGVVLENIRGDIEFKDIKFAYPSRPDTLVLHNFNLTVTAGMTIGLVGSSGSGKSTVISLLERFYDPLEGDILLDGHSIKSLQLKWLRSQMGLVSQEPVLFATSIKENILFGNEGASMELVVSAAKAANAHDFITKFPEGYETQVGQSGVQMSGGQKQRIAIARALIKEPQILLLDEATSALDAQSEREVQDALDQASVGRTTIIIAHRLSTISKANSIVVLQAGEVLESGFHDQLILMGEGGAYFAMFQLQQSALIDEASNSPCSPTEERNKKTREMNFNKRSPGKSFIADHSYSDSKEENNKLPSYSHQLRLLQMNAPEWNRALIGCFGAITFGAVQPISTYCMGTVIWVFSLKDNDLIRSQTRIYCLLFASLAVISVVTNLLQHYNFAIMGERLVKRVREKILEKVLTFEIGWFDQDENSSAAICARLATEANMVRSLVGDRISLLVQVTATALLSFVLAAVITWRLSIVMIAMQPLIIACFYSKKVLMTKLSGKAVKAQNEGSQLASEAVVNHRTITAFSLQKRILGLFKDSLRGPRHDTLKLSWLAGFGLSVSQFLTTTSIALAFWYGGRLLIQRLVTPKHLFQAFFILMGMGKFIADAGSATTDLAKGGNAVKSIFRILDRRSEIHPDDPKGIKVTTIKGHVELKGVYFSYPSRPEQIIFNGLSLNIEAGKTVALVGQSGSGKSTIIGLIERFYDPLKGSIEIDEQDVKNYNLRSLRSKIALVSQEPTLFSGTIRENILYGNVNATETELMEAAAIANAHEFISGMKDGYETQCGVRGVQLSGGQKQRIALARAILTNPKILLLDEATNALDSISENLVQEALEKMMVDRTCVVIAHRLSTIRKSDSIAVIENGRITEQGAHSDLLALGHCGSYYSLVKLQQDSSSA